MNRPPAFELRGGAVLLYDLPELSIYAGKGGYGVRFTVLVAVRNDSYHKEVGISWRPVIVAGTGEQPAWQRSGLSYVGPLFDGTELWGGACKAAGPVTDRVELAAFAVMNGVEYWDNANGRNYQVKGSPPSPARPIAAVGIVTAQRSFEGSAIVWDYEGDRQVHIVYSSDQWRTVSLTKAKPSSGTEFSWRAEIPATAREVDFIARLAIGGVAFSTAGRARSYASPGEATERDRPLAGAT